MKSLIAGSNERGDGQKESGPFRAALVSLGCAKNLVDSEVLVHQIRSLGYEMTEEPADARLIVVNTCGFLESAVQEAIDVILDMARWKRDGSCKFLVVVGCMVQRYGKKLPPLLPEVDLFLGTSHYHRFAHVWETFLKKGKPSLWIARPTYLHESRIQRCRNGPEHTAYVKIAEGCSNRCTFCVIPQLRGPYRSRTVSDVVREVQSLAAEGVVEVNLIAQDTTAFGSDRGESGALVVLLERLDGVQGLQWIRLLYSYPHRVTDDLLRTMAQSDKVVPYLDIPFQHAVPRLLALMRRTDHEQHPMEVIERIRKHLPDAALRTSLMVGFPGETNRDFDALCRFVEEVRFDHMGVFAFSPEKGCRAARFSGAVPEDVKEDRRRILMELQKDISRAKLEGLVGKRVRVLVEGPHPETELLGVGRLPTQAPEVDGHVIIVEGAARPGRITWAQITRAHDYDVEARLGPGSGDESK